MAAIVIQDLVDDAIEWLPPENTLSEATLTTMAEDVVAFRIPEDDDVYYSQALCILLQNAAIRNKAVSVSSSNLKKDKTGDVTYEYDVQYGDSGWDAYLKSLSDVCPILPGGGYNLPSSFGISISPGTTPQILDCNNEDSDPYF